MNNYFVMFILIFTLFFSIIYANDKGRISLIMNEAKIDLPINSVTLRKENNIILTARAELNDEKIKQLISIEISFNSLSRDSIDIYNSFLLEVRSQGNTLSSREIMVLRLGDDRYHSESSYTKGTKSWAVNPFVLKFDVSEIEFAGNHLIIKGTFSTQMRSQESNTPFEPIVEIKDGMFEIII